MNIQYRKLQSGDVLDYRQIRLEGLRLFPDSFGSTYAEESAKPKLAFEIYIENQQPGKFIMGAFDGGILMGICGFVREETIKNNHKGLIIQMYVKPTYAGKGIGLQLLQATINEAFTLAGVEQLILGVVETNLSAIKIYEKAGFKTFGLQQNYFKDGDRGLHQRFMIFYRQA